MTSHPKRACSYEGRLEHKITWHIASRLKNLKIICINLDLELSIYSLIPALKRNLTAKNVNVIASGKV